MEAIKTNEKVCIELKEIISYLDPSIRNKFPKNLIQKLDKFNSEYEFKYDTSKTLNEQEIQKQTKELLAGLYLKYCCNETEAIDLIGKCKQNDIENSKKYEINWETRKNKDVNSNAEKKELQEETQENLQTEKSLQIIDGTKNNFITRLFNKIKNLFRK